MSEFSDDGWDAPDPIIAKPPETQHIVSASQERPTVSEIKCRALSPMKSEDFNQISASPLPINIAKPDEKIESTTNHEDKRMPKFMPFARTESRASTRSWNTERQTNSRIDEVENEDLVSASNADSSFDKPTNSVRTNCTISSMVSGQGEVIMPKHVATTSNIAKCSPFKLPPLSAGKSTPKSECEWTTDEESRPSKRIPMVKSSTNLQTASSISTVTVENTNPQDDGWTSEEDVCLGQPISERSLKPNLGADKHEEIVDDTNGKAQGFGAQVEDSFVEEKIAFGQPQMDIQNQVLSPPKSFVTQLDEKTSRFAKEHYQKQKSSEDQTVVDCFVSSNKPSFGISEECVEQYRNKHDTPKNDPEVRNSSFASSRGLSPLTHKENQHEPSDDQFVESNKPSFGVSDGLVRTTVVEEFPNTRDTSEKNIYVSRTSSFGSSNGWNEKESPIYEPSTVGFVESTKPSFGRADGLASLTVVDNHQELQENEPSNVAFVSSSKPSFGRFDGSDVVQELPKDLSLNSGFLESKNSSFGHCDGAVQSTAVNQSQMKQEPDGVLITMKPRFGSIKNECRNTEEMPRNGLGFGESRKFNFEQSSGFLKPKGFGTSPENESLCVATPDEGIRSEVTTSTFGGLNDTFGGHSSFGEKQVQRGFGSRNADDQGSTSFGGGERRRFGENDSGFGRREETSSSSGAQRQYSNNCNNCGEEGHFAKECLKACRNCGEEGHISRDCTQPKVKKCGRCHMEGHFARECSEPAEPPTDPCRRCQEEGHWSYDCPTLKRDYDGNILESYDPEFKTEEELFAEVVENTKIIYDQKVVSCSGGEPTSKISKFEDIEGLPPQVLSNLKRMKLVRPTAIQAHTYYPILSGKDLVACAHTGCGKTLAFLLPLVTRLASEDWSDDDGLGSACAPRCLIVAPTRELAVQTFETARQLCYKTGITTSIVYGGYTRTTNLQNLATYKKLGILVATMGRLNDFMRSEHITLSKMKYVVLDEADRMIDMRNFGTEVNALLGEPSDRTAQVLLFSASFSDELQMEAMPKVVRDGYAMILADKFGTANEIIEQSVIQVSRGEKQDALFRLLGIDTQTFDVEENSRIQRDKTLIFVNSISFAIRLTATISQCGIPAIMMHSQIKQQHRDELLRDFRRGKYSVMVASNVCARGLHISGLNHVINYDLPFEDHFDEYVNRIGRTGRAGFEGDSTAFFCPETDGVIVKKLISVIQEAGKKVPEWLYEYSQQEEQAMVQSTEEW